MVVFHQAPANICTFTEGEEKVLSGKNDLLLDGLIIYISEKLDVFQFKGNCHFPTGYMGLGLACVQTVELNHQVLGDVAAIQPLLKPAFPGEGRKAIISQGRLCIWQSPAQVTLKCSTCTTGNSTGFTFPWRSFFLWYDLMNFWGKVHETPSSELWY